MKIIQADLITTVYLFLVIAGLITYVGALIVYSNKKKSKKKYGFK